MKLGVGATTGVDIGPANTVNVTVCSRVRLGQAADFDRPPPSSTTPPAGRTPCSPAQVEAEVTTDKTVYRPGETVKVSGTLRNRSGGPCYYTNYAGSNQIDGPSGQPARPNTMFIADAFADTQLPAGATLTQNPTWDQQLCIGGPIFQCERPGQAPPGTYTVKVGWRFGGEPAEASATFRLVA